ncbi:hypothetical protein ACGGAQ_19625 [Micromonospora sp. NPDC047557]|uniref:hypothetical protein n=1 Tax=Micromonospora sp. NPDC047557 TaxID=3364250 RepID=UPI003719031E
MSRNVKRALVLAGGVVLSLAVVAPGPAQAASKTAYTSPSGYGYATFNTSTRKLTVQDTNGDSRRVVAFVYNESLGGLFILGAQDANGSNGTPGTATAPSGSYHSGDTLSIEVCRRNGSAGADTDCGWATVIA